MDSIVQYLHDQRSYTYVQTAALAWLAYDISLTFEDEVSYVWSRAWRLSKVLYMIARYFGLAILISHVAGKSVALALACYLSTNYVMKRFSSLLILVYLSCRRWLDFYSSGPIIIAFAVDALLVIRIYALYGRSKRMLVLLLCLLFGQPIIVIATTVNALNSVILFSKFSFLPYPGCLGTEPANMEPTLAGWIFTLIAQGVFFALTLLKYIQSIRTDSRHDGTHSVFSYAKENHNVSPVISLFLRDGTANFAVIFASMVINMVFTILLNGPDQQIGIPWIVATNAVMGSRLYLNLQGVMVGLVVPSLSATEYQVELPSGASMTMVSRDQLHLHWNYQRASYPSARSIAETLAGGQCSGHGKDDTFIRMHNFITSADYYNHNSVDPALNYPVARIPSLVFEPVEFEGFVPEEISLSKLESASGSAQRERRGRFSGGTALGAQSTSTLLPKQSKEALKSAFYDGNTERSLQSAHMKRPSYLSAASDLVIHQCGSPA